MGGSADGSVDRAVFDATANDYDRARKRLVPQFDDFYGAALRELRFPADRPLRILDLGAGTGLLSDMIARRFPEAHVTLIDISPEMIARARQRLGEGPRFDYRVADLASAHLPKPVDAVVSALAIHHLPDPDKRVLFGRIYQSLKPGAVFVNAEQVAGPSQVLQQRQHWSWLADARALGASEEEIGQALVRMREDRPATLDDQLDWLRGIGFAEVDCVWKRGMFAVYSGQMPLAAEERSRPLFGLERALRRT
ncbi:MAG: class I SAM-dependent methyltransferase [Pseudomonadota bacterium]|nr:class I SAM-dependent methyltransferase [Pseudomonadota bacterium]